VDPLEQAAGQLYGEAPSGFIAARNARAAEAKTSGDRELAAGIRSLAKPSVAAWAVNALVRHRPGDVQPLLELGERMRDATDSGDRDAVRQLGRERQQLLAAAASAARALGDELGVPVSDAAAVEVQQTLQAAVVDPAATAAVRTGLLVRTFSSTGVDPVELDGAVALAGAGAVEPVAAPSTATRPRAVGTRATEKKPGAAKAAPEESREQARERAAAERASRALAAAKREAEEARQDAEDAQAELATTELRIRENRARHEQLAEEQQELRERLDEVQGELTDTNVTAARLRKERASAVRAAEAAERLASRARTRLASLAHDDDDDIDD
jgi:DNA repair exonuclease SbcCD ATPase subunit